MSNDPGAVDIGLRLLDLPIHDLEDHVIGKVDDLELTVPGDGTAPYLSAVLTGPLALGARYGGRLGWWWRSIAARVHPDPNPTPLRIGWDRCELEPTLVRVAVHDPDDLGAQRVEDWLRTHLIARIPGARR